MSRWSLRSCDNAEGYTLRNATGVKGTVYYSHFRRFTVRTRETIDVPKP
jgi:hypothetical protein